MIENTLIETTLNRAFVALEVMLGCQTTTKTKIKPKVKRKKKVTKKDD